MTKINISTIKDLNTFAKGATSEISKGRKSPFFCINTLNKFAAKNEFCNNEKVKPVADLVRKLHGGRYPFVIELFPKVNGTYYKKVEKVDDPFILASLMCGEIVNDCKGRPVCLDDENNAIIVTALPTTPETMFTAFKAFVADDMRTAAKIQKQANKAAKSEETARRMQKRAAQKRIKELSVMLCNGEITPEEFTEKVNAAKSWGEKSVPSGKHTPTHKGGTISNVA